MNDYSNQDVSDKETMKIEMQPSDRSSVTPQELKLKQKRCSWIHKLFEPLWKYKVVVLLCVGLFCIAGVPVLINELYKHPGYVTLWTAADVLGYYGTVLGAFVGIGTLVMTIWFTRRQIQRESFLKAEKEKWDKIEQVFVGALTVINPRQAIEKSTLNFQENPMEKVECIQEYQLDCCMAIDQLNGYLSNMDYPKVEKLVGAIQKASNKYCDITRQCVDLYTLMANYMNQNTARETLEIEKRIPHSFPSETIDFCENMLNQIDGVKLDEIQEKIGQAKNELTFEYMHSFRDLLRLKGSTFNTIYSELEKEADSILFPLKKD